MFNNETNRQKAEDQIELFDNFFLCKVSAYLTKMANL